MTSDPVIQSQFNKSRLDKFLLVFNLPTILKSINTNDLSVRSQNLINQNTFQFSVYGSVIPTITVPEIAAGYSGQSYKVSSGNRPVYENITVNFTVDNQFNNYWVLNKWLNLLNDEYQSVYKADETVSNLDVTTGNKLNPILQPQAYQTDFTLYAKDEFDQNIVKFTYTKAFPVSLGGINYSYRTEDEIETSLEFAFSQFFTELV